MQKDKLHIIYTSLFASLAVGLIGYIFLSNLAPFGITRIYVSGTNTNISKLGPSERVIDINTTNELFQKQIHDMAYFSTNIDYQFDKAKIKITFQNPYPDQDIYLGFQDSDEWHYATKLIHTPILDDINWVRTGTNPTLFQKTNQYSSVEEFFSNPPSEQIVGIYNLDKNLLIQGELTDYTPQDTLTVIDTPLRGRHTLYAYLKNQPFYFSIEKQDLNWYEGSDILTIKIFKDQELVHSQVIEDDGIEDDSKQTATAQKTVIEHPGPDFPEAGIYKIILEAPGDIIIKKISTNLHKLVFESPIFLAQNHQAYPHMFQETKPTQLFTDALVLAVKTYHPQGLQEIQVGDSTLELESLGQEEASATTDIITEVNVSENDIILNGLIGNFAFSADSLFKPTPYNLLSLTTKENLTAADFVLSSYMPTKTQGGWKIAEAEFDLSAAVTKNGKLSWIIQSPRLIDNNREILIKKIEVELHKSPTF